MRPDEIRPNETSIDQDSSDEPQVPSETAPRQERPEAATAEALDEVTGPRDLRRGDIVEGIVAAVTEEGVHVDVGAKFEGLVPRAEFTTDDELPAVDERIEVAVVHVDEDDGIIRLSKKRADYERMWRRLYRARETGEVLTAVVTDRVKGGLRVDVGVPGFVPASQVAARSPRALDRLVGRELKLKVLEVDRSKKQVVLSHKIVVEEERERRRKETLARLYEGAVVEGRVRSITDYGAFIDLGGIDGLLHISEMSWVRVDHPSQLLKVGQRIKVMVLRIENNGERISLGRRQILPDPWSVVADKIKPGDILHLRISRIVRTGAFARVEGIEGLELEGFIPVREMAQRSVSDPRDVVQVGQQVEAKVLELRPEARRMTLSIAEAQQEREREEYRRIMAERMGEPPRRTLGDALREAGVLPEEATAEAEETDNTQPQQTGPQDQPDQMGQTA